MLTRAVQWLALVVAVVCLADTSQQHYGGSGGAGNGSHFENHKLTATALDAYYKLRESPRLSALASERDWSAGGAGRQRSGRYVAARMALAIPRCWNASVIWKPRGSTQLSALRKRLEGKLKAFNEERRPPSNERLIPGHMFLIAEGAASFR